jgi:hypothetical protein
MILSEVLKPFRHERHEKLMQLRENENIYGDIEKIVTYLDIKFLYIHLFGPLSSSYFIQNFGKNYACNL